LLVVKGLPLKHREFFQSLRTYPSCAEAKIKRGAALEACYCYVISVEKSEVNRTILKSWWDQTQTGNLRPVRLAYQPPASSTFLSEQSSHQQPASSTFLSEQTSTSHQPPANRTGC
jgi:hypothetical protein